MTEQCDQLVTTLRQLAKDREERDLIRAAIRALDARYDLSAKMEHDSGVEEIIKQLFGRLERAFGNLGAIKGKRILDIACGSNSSKAPVSIYIDTPFGETNINTTNTASYTAQFEPWFCRVLLQLDAEPVGIDFGDLDEEAFEHYRVDLGQPSATSWPLNHTTPTWAAHAAKSKSHRSWATTCSWASIWSICKKPCWPAAQTS